MTGRVVILILGLLHLALYAVGAVRHWIDPLHLFNLLMLAAVVTLAWRAWLVQENRLVPAGMLLLIMAHTFVGQRIAPDTLTSGAILLTSLLTLYVGVKINTCLPRRHWWVFTGSFFLLYALFVLRLRNSEPLFILFLLAMTACARSLRLMAYFWAAVISFSFCQPYAWPALLVSFFILTAVVGARGSAPSGLTLGFLGAGLSLVFFVLLPVILVMLGEDLHSLELMLRDPRIRSAIRLTVITATLSTAVLFLFSVPLAYALARLRFPGRALLLSLADLPIVIPQSAAGMALLHVFGRRQVLGGWFADSLGLPIDGTVLGICLAQVFVALPFLLRSAVVAFEGVSEELELTARSLGASAWSAFRRVAFPLASRGVVLGTILAWARAAGEFGAVIFIAPSPETAPVAAFNRFNSVGMAEAAPLVSLLLLFSLAMFFLLQWTTRLLPAAHTPSERNW